ncbi:hypothetical protein [Microcoleus sp. w1-18aA5]|uniref:hypothetical protein n=1 Tax=Microcoleus sp. w1-18aA5 TaxID=2818982 RepID=UPI002FCEA54B
MYFPLLTFGVAVFPVLALAPISRMPKFDRKTIALRHLKFETTSRRYTKSQICQRHLGNNNTRAIEIGEARSHFYFFSHYLVAIVQTALDTALAKIRVQQPVDFPLQHVDFPLQHVAVPLLKLKPIHRESIISLHYLPDKTQAVFPIFLTAVAILRCDSL